jgi:hypothetical protein
MMTKTTEVAISARDLAARSRLEKGNESMFATDLSRLQDAASVKSPNVICTAVSPTNTAVSARSNLGHTQLRSVRKS